MTRWNRSMVPVGIAAFALLVRGGTAFACTNYVGKGTVKGDNSPNVGTSVGLQCGDNHNGPNSNCNQGMSITFSGSYPDANSAGTLQITMAAAPTGAACYGISGGSGVCQLNASSAVNYPSGNSGYNITEIQTGFPSHTSTGTLTVTNEADDCMTWAGNPSGYVEVATATPVSTCQRGSSLRCGGNYTHSFRRATETGVGTPTARGGAG